MPRPLVVKCTAGPSEAERLNQAFTVAATAVSAGVPVILWLTGDSVWFAVEGRAPELDLLYATPPSDLLAAVLAGGTVTVCTQCARRRGITESDVLPGVRIAGAATFAEEVLQEEVQALVY